jgi:aconitate hydratase
VAHGVKPADFNSYGARRGHDDVMTRGTFANIRLRNLIAPGTEGGWTTYKGERMSIFDASLRYKSDGVGLLVIAGKEYGSGSSRDWAAKGAALLGVKAVLAESYERIHRSNLVAMGILPFEFLPGESRETHGLTGYESFEFTGIADAITGSKMVPVHSKAEDGTAKSFTVRLRVDTPREVEYFRSGGILPYVLRQVAARQTA